MCIKNYFIQFLGKEDQVLKNAALKLLIIFTMFEIISLESYSDCRIKIEQQ